jgi:hypothetical protein
MKLHRQWADQVRILTLRDGTVEASLTLNHGVTAGTGKTIPAALASLEKALRALPEPLSS